MLHIVDSIRILFVYQPNACVLSCSGNCLLNRIRFWQSYTWSNAVTDGRPNLCRIFRFQFPTIIFELSSQFQCLFVCRECLGLQVLIVLTFLSFRFSRTVLQGRNRQNPFHGQASPVGVWSFLSLSSTRRAVKKNQRNFENKTAKMRKCLTKLNLADFFNAERCRSV